MAYLAQTKVGLGETATAIELYKQVLQQSPTSIEIHQRLGLLHLKDGRTEEAKDCFQRILEIDANNTQAKVHLEIAQQLIERENNGPQADQNQ
jgi:tetratricopeptide (TPR) repeat protein